MYVPAVVWLVLLILVACQAAICLSGSRASLSGQVDLRAFYATAWIVRHHEASRLYQYSYQEQVQNELVSHRNAPLPFLYPPFAALVFVPLSLLPYRLAFAASCCLNLLLLLLAGQLLRPWLPALQASPWCLLPLLYASLFGVSIALMQGQISFLLLLLFCGAYTLLQGQHDRLAGLLLALTLIKFQLALPVIALYIIWRRWRVVGGFLAGAVALALISWGLTGTAGLASYPHAMYGLANDIARHAAEAKIRYGMFPTDMPNLHGLTYELSRGRLWGQEINILLSSAVMLFAASRKPSLLVALPAAMLVSYHMQPHDLVLLLLPLSFLIDESIARLAQGVAPLWKAWSGADLWLASALLLLTLPLAAVVMVFGMTSLVAIAILIVLAMASHKPILFISA